MAQKDSTSKDHHVKVWSEKNNISSLAHIRKKNHPPRSLAFFHTFLHRSVRPDASASVSATSAAGRWREALLLREVHLSLYRLAMGR